MSSNSSDSTLIDPDERERFLPISAHPKSGGIQIDQPDVPVDVDRYEWDVTVRKYLLLGCLPLCLDLQISHLVMLIRNPQLTVRGDITMDIIGIILTAMAILGLACSVLYPPMRYPGVHRTFCTGTFVILLSNLVVHLIPGIMYTLTTHLTSPRHFPVITILRNICLTISLIIVGSIRRGPKLHYTPMKIATSFGLNAEKATSDDEQENGSNVLDWMNSSMIAMLLLFFTAALARRSTKVEQLSLSDLPHLQQPIRQSGLRDINPNVSRATEEEEERVTSWSLLKAVWADRIGIAALSLVFEFVKTAVSFSQVVCSYQIIKSFSEPKGSDKGFAYLMCWGVLAGQITDVILTSYLAIRENYQLHLPVRMTLASLLFSKILRTTDVKETEAEPTDVEAKSKGRAQVMNLLTTDVTSVASLAVRGPNVTNCLISLTIGITLLYSMLGVSAFVGLASLLFATPISIWITKQIYHCDKVWARTRDARIRGIKEFLLGVKVIKLNAFEEYYQRNIERLRDEEVIWQRWRYTLGTLVNVVADQTPIIAIVLAFFFHTKVLHRPLEPATAFTALTVLYRVKDSFGVIPSTIQSLAMMKVSLDRLASFLNQSEVQISDLDRSDSISCQGATIGWPGAVENSFKLYAGDLDLPSGSITLVCGNLGSGKTLFLRALLGEASIQSGFIRSPHSAPDAIPIDSCPTSKVWTVETWLDNSVAYAPQQSFIRHGTIRDNILFGQPYWPERYLETLRQVSLISDLELMDDGDLTEIGEKGINLSGGQKARVNLARCVYSRARTVYLDDILSAVDAHTAKHIVEFCFAGELFKGRTVVLVTHHVELCLPVAEFVVSLADGCVKEAGPPSKMNLTSVDPGHFADQLIDSVPPKELREMKENSKTRQIYTAEHMAKGHVDISHYLLVLSSAGGMWYWILFLVIYFGSQVVDTSQAFWLRRWTSHPDPSDLDVNIEVYTIMVFSLVLLGSAKWIWLYGVGNVGFYNRASRRIHSQLLNKICSAPLSFFETTPSGRIMNMFGQDFWRLDSSAADDFARTLSLTLTVATSTMVIGHEAPLLLPIIAALGIPCFWISRIVRKLRADTRRLNAVAGSPLVSLYHDTIDGVVMVRAFGISDITRAVMIALINRERQATLADITAWYWIRGSILSVAGAMVTATVFFLVSSDVQPAQGALILNFAINVSQHLYSLTEQYGQLDQTFVSAERVNHYIKMPYTESKEGIVPPSTWPSEGRVSIKELSVRYADDLPDVLHGVSVDLEPGQRVGIVGATGSGKSTLAMCLFRAMEAREGKIEIDGINIKDVEVRELRRRLNMVVQDASLGSGTLREALDITKEKDDYEIFDVLRRVHLLPDSTNAEALKANPFANLDTFVAVEGANFSQGEKQLLCLARALLKKSKILVMDEATSSVDFETDAKITTAIKECFKNTTMLVIAHRLATIMHYDRVLVLDRGKVLEFGHPRELMLDEHSAFRSLCTAHGEEEFSKLLEMTERGE